jgi:hypothetical protein
MCRVSRCVRLRLASINPGILVGNLPERRSQEVACISLALIKHAFGECPEALDAVIGEMTADDPTARRWCKVVSPGRRSADGHAAVLMFPPLQSRLASASGPMANWTDRHFGSKRGSGYASQFWVGVLLGAVWTPCVGLRRRFASRCAGPRRSAGRRQHARVGRRRRAALTDHRAFVAKRCSAGASRPCR